MKIKDYFCTLKKDALLHAVRSIGLKGYSKKKKAELAEFLSGKVLDSEYIKTVIVGQSDKTIELMEKLIEEKELEIKYAGRLMDFLYSGYIMIDEKRKCLVLCDEVPELFRQALTDDVKKDREVYHKVKCYCNAFIRLYGAIDMVDAYRIYDKQNGDISPEDFVDAVMFFAKKTMDWEIYMNSIVSSPLMSDDEYENLMDAQRNKHRYIPSRRKIMNYDDFDYIEDTNEYRELKRFVKLNLKLDKETAEDLSEEIYFNIEYGCKPSEVFDIVDGYGIIFDTQEQGMKFMDIVIRLMNNTRMPYNKGNTPNELSAIRRPVLEDLPPVPMFRQPVIKQQKIGRNEPCPCGSGKKYKKCCGR